MQDDVKRIALVSGANKGIGYDIARSLAQAGLRVLLGARHASLGEVAAARLRDAGLGVQFVELVDLTNAATVQAMANRIGSEFKHRLLTPRRAFPLRSRYDMEPGTRTHGFATPFHQETS